MKLIFISLACLALTNAEAADFTPTHLIVHIASAHSKPGYNNNNPGIGLRWADAQGDGPVAGVYNNSERSMSAYVGYSWNWQISEPLSAQIMVGGVTGYKRATVVPMLIPSVAYAVTPSASIRVSFAPAIARVPAVAHLSLDFKF